MNPTRWIIAIITAVVLIVDITLAVIYGVEGTISVQITAWSHEYPIIAFVWGFLMGHFFTQNQKGTAPK